MKLALSVAVRLLHLTLSLVDKLLGQKKAFKLQFYLWLRQVDIDYLYSYILCLTMLMKGHCLVDDNGNTKCKFTSYYDISSWRSRGTVPEAIIFLAAFFFTI